MKRRIDYKGEELVFLIKDQEDHIQRMLSLGSLYEKQMLDYIHENYQGKVFVDCGANIGTHSIFFAKACKSLAVYSFEPHKDNFNHLKQNIELNNCEEIVNSFDFALGHINREVGMKLPKGGNKGMFQVDMDSKGVLMTELSSIVMQCDVIKIDVEGFNLPLLIGSEALIKKCYPDIFMECATIVELFEGNFYLENLGYKREDIVFNSTPTYLWKKSQ